MFAHQPGKLAQETARSWAKSTRLRPNFADVDRSQAALCRNRVKIGPRRSNFGRRSSKLAHFGQSWPIPNEIWPESNRFRSGYVGIQVKAGRDQPKIVRNRSEVGPVRPNLERRGPNLARVRPRVARMRLNLATLGPDPVQVAPALMASGKKLTGITALASR